MGSCSHSTECIFGKLQDDGKLLPSERTGRGCSQFSWGQSPSEKHFPSGQLHHAGRVTDTRGGLNCKLLKPSSGHLRKWP